MNRTHLEQGTVDTAEAPQGNAPINKQAVTPGVLQSDSAQAVFPDLKVIQKI